MLLLVSSYVAPSIPRFVSLEMRTVDTLGRLSLLTTFWRSYADLDVGLSLCLGRDGEADSSNSS
jgi:hypothetical protein